MPGGRTAGGDMSTFSWKTAPCHARKYTARGDKRQSLPDTCGIGGSLRVQSEEPWKNEAPGIRRSGCRGRSVQGMTDGVRGSQERWSGSLFLWFRNRCGDCLGAVPKDRRLVCRILFDAEDGSVVGVNDHIEDLSILDDFNLVLAFFVFVFRLGCRPLSVQRRLWPGEEWSSRWSHSGHRYQPVRNRESGKKQPGLKEGQVRRRKDEDVFS